MFANLDTSTVDVENFGMKNRLLLDDTALAATNLPLESPKSLCFCPMRRITDIRESSENCRGQTQPNNPDGVRLSSQETPISGRHANAVPQKSFGFQLARLSNSFSLAPVSDSLCDNGAI
jgi:hypothetical protein